MKYIGKSFLVFLFNEKGNEKELKIGIKNFFYALFKNQRFYYYQH